MSSPQEGARVLHVDDEPGFADMAAEFLHREDEWLAVETVTSAMDALRRLETNAIDCVVSDFDMPGQTGIDLLKEVREEHPELPFILFTGKGSEEIASDAISAGVTDYLQKEASTDQFAVLANRIRNVVEKRRAELETDRLRAQQQAITQNITDAVVTIDTNSTILFANPGVENLVGYSPAEAEGKPLTRLMPERYRSDHASAVRRYLTTGERTMDWRNVEFHVLHRDGHEVPVSLSFGEFELSGETRFIGVLRDVTDQKRRIEQLRESQAELRLYERVVENSTDLLAAVDKDYAIIFANEQYLKFHGLSQDDVGNFSLPDVLEDEWGRGVKRHIDRALAGEEVQYEMDRKGADGLVHWFDLRNYPLTDADGTIIGTVGAMRDITERKERDGDSEGQ